MKAAILSLVTALALAATAGTADARPPYYRGGYSGARYFPTFGSPYGYSYYPGSAGYNYGYGYGYPGISISIGRGVGYGGYPSYGYPSYYGGSYYARPYYSSGYGGRYYRGWRW